MIWYENAQIDNQEDGDESQDDGEDVQASDLSEEGNNDLASEQSLLSAENDQAGSSNEYELSNGNIEAMDEKKYDDSDDWLASEDEQNRSNNEEDSSCPLKTTDDQQIQCSKDLHISQGQSGAHVKTSAITRVGLRVLLQLIDERLRDQDNKSKAKYVVERSIIDRKWRAPREEEIEVAV